MEFGGGGGEISPDIPISIKLAKNKAHAQPIRAEFHEGLGSLQAYREWFLCRIKG